MSMIRYPVRTEGCVEAGTFLPSRRTRYGDQIHRFILSIPTGRDLVSNLIAWSPDNQRAIDLIFDRGFLAERETVIRTLVPEAWEGGPQPLPAPSTQWRLTRTAGLVEETLSLETSNDDEELVGPFLDDEYIGSMPVAGPTARSPSYSTIYRDQMFVQDFLDSDSERGIGSDDEDPTDFMQDRDLVPSWTRNGLAPLRLGLYESPFMLSPEMRAAHATRGTIHDEHFPLR